MYEQYMLVAEIFKKVSPKVEEDTDFKCLRAEPIENDNSVLDASTVSFSGAERIVSLLQFTNFSAVQYLVHSKLRNWLGAEEEEKLIFYF